MAEWENSRYAECPSFMSTGNEFLLTTSVCPFNKPHFFDVMVGSFDNGVFKSELSGNTDKGPDQYAGQVFKDHLGRCIHITWIPGWKYSGYAEKDIGCMSVPRSIFVKDGKICEYPIDEFKHLLKDTDPALTMTEDGFFIERTNREKVIHTGKVDDLKVIRDEYILEVFVNGGETVYSVLL